MSANHSCTIFHIFPHTPDVNISEQAQAFVSQISLHFNQIFLVEKYIQIIT